MLGSIVGVRRRQSEDDDMEDYDHELISLIPNIIKRNEDSPEVKQSMHEANEIDVQNEFTCLPRNRPHHCIIII